MENVNDPNVTNIQDEPVGTGTSNVGTPIKPKFFTAKTITIIIAIVIVISCLIISIL